MTNIVNHGREALVSVCVITYNHRNYISQCLESILMQQTNFPFEIILGEDESSDGTRELCIEYANKHDKIKLLLRSRKDVIYINGKPSGRFNYIESAKAASGKYISICEGDDYWTDPHKLQKQVDFLEANPDYAICFHEAKKLYEDGTETLFNNIGHDATFNFYHLTQRNFISTASYVFRVHDHLHPLPGWFSKLSAGDWGLHLLNATKGKIFFMNECMSVYRIHSAGMWSSMTPEQACKKEIEIMDQLNAAFNYEYDKYFQEGKAKRIASYNTQLLTQEKPVQRNSISKKIKRRLSRYLQALK